MKLLSGAVLILMLIGSNLQAFDSNGKGNDKDKSQAESWVVTGFRDVAGELEVEKKFLAVPDAKLAEEHLQILTQAPHIAGSPEDKATAEYVAKKFRDAGLETEIVEYKVWLNYPAEIRVDLTAPDGVEMHGPHREHVADPGRVEGHLDEVRIELDERVRRSCRIPNPGRKRLGARGAEAQAAGLGRFHDALRARPGEAGGWPRPAERADDCVFLRRWRSRTVVAIHFDG